MSIVEYFFVTTKKRRDDGSLIVGLLISPYFQTLEESKTFRDNCEIEGAYCLGGGFFPMNEEEAEQDRIMLFGSETEPAMTEAICYWIENNRRG